MLWKSAWRSARTGALCAITAINGSRWPDLGLRATFGRQAALALRRIVCNAAYLLTGSGGTIHMTSMRWPRCCRGWILAATLSSLPFGIVLSGSALALGPKDIQDCQSSPDAPRMVQACTAIAEEKRIPADMRSMALLKRGFGNFALDRLDAALADFRAAIELNPRNNYAHHELGLTLVKKGDFDAALAALDMAVKLDPRSAGSRYMRGIVLAALGRMDDAIQDYSAAIALGADRNTAFTKHGQLDRPASDRVEADYFVARADALYLTGRFGEAVADYERAKKFPDPDGYNLVWSTLARTGAGSPNATAGLARALDAGGLTGWPKMVGELVAGRVTATTAVAAAKNADQECEAHFYVGTLSLAAKDLASARRELSIARDRCQRSFREYGGAVALLKRLDR
jgi:tetratricopeptide (TPR) repeat protein